MELTERETELVLFALRNLQRERKHTVYPDDIDLLCEKINCGEEKQTSAPGPRRPPAP